MGCSFDVALSPTSAGEMLEPFVGAIGPLELLDLAGCQRLRNQVRNRFHRHGQLGPISTLAFTGHRKSYRTPTWLPAVEVYQVHRVLDERVDQEPRTRHAGNQAIRNAP